MTSTEKGTFNDRNSSRVLRPPGGGSSNIFAFATEDSDDRNRKSTNDNKSSANTTAAASDPLSPQVNNVVNSDEKPVTEGDKASQENNCESSKPPSVAAGGERPTQDMPSVDRATLANRGRAGGSNFNILTGEPLKTEQQSSTAAAGVRVRQPPGGASTKLW